MYRQYRSSKPERVGTHLRPHLQPLHRLILRLNLQRESHIRSRVVVTAQDPRVVGEGRELDVERFVHLLRLALEEATAARNEEGVAGRGKYRQHSLKGGYQPQVIGEG
jgi:hypothetical protein